MNRNICFLIAVILLYLIPSLILQGIYGQSYGFLSGEDYWMPDDNGGWVKHGEPNTLRPSEPSVKVPIAVRYIPIFFPGLLLFLFLFTPLRNILEKPPETDKNENENPTD